MRGLREGAVTKEVVSVMTDVNSGDWSKVSTCCYFDMLLFISFV